MNRLITIVLILACMLTAEANEPVAADTAADASTESNNDQKDDAEEADDRLFVEVLEIK